MPFSLFSQVIPPSTYSVLLKEVTAHSLRQVDKGVISAQERFKAQYTSTLKQRKYLLQYRENTCNSIPQHKYIGNIYHSISQHWNREITNTSPHWNILISFHFFTKKWEINLITCFQYYLQLSQKWELGLVVTQVKITLTVSTLKYFYLYVYFMYFHTLLKSVFSLYTKGYIKHTMLLISIQWSIQIPTPNLSNLWLCFIFNLMTICSAFYIYT